MTKGKIYQNKECHLFQQGIPTLLWSKIICYLEITFPNYHPEDPYEVDQVFEAAKWVLKSTDTTMTSKKLATASTTTVPTIHSPATAPVTIVKKEPLDVATAAIINALACMEEKMEVVLNAGSSA